MSGRLTDPVNVMELRHRERGFDIRPRARDIVRDNSDGEGADHHGRFSLCKSRERRRLQEWIGWQHKL